MGAPWRAANSGPLAAGICSILLTNTQLPVQPPGLFQSTIVRDEKQEQREPSERHVPNSPANKKPGNSPQGNHWVGEMMEEKMVGKTG